MRIQICICNRSEMCNQRFECHHSKMHDYLTETCIEGFCSISGRLCRCEILDGLTENYYKKYIEIER